MGDDDDDDDGDGDDDDGNYDDDDDDDDNDYDDDEYCHCHGNDRYDDSTALFIVFCCFTVRTMIQRAHRWFAHSNVNTSSAQP